MVPLVKNGGLTLSRVYLKKFNNGRNSMYLRLDQRVIVNERTGVCYVCYSSPAVLLMYLLDKICLRSALIVWQIWVKLRDAVHIYGPKKTKPIYFFNSAYTNFGRVELSKQAKT